jgi:hypothetical protein
MCRNRVRLLLVVLPPSEPINTAAALSAEYCTIQQFNGTLGVGTFKTTRSPNDLLIQSQSSPLMVQSSSMGCSGGSAGRELWSTVQQARRFGLGQGGPKVTELTSRADGSLRSCDVPRLFPG